MARTNSTSFAGGLQFPYATAATDLFKKEDVQVLAQAVDQHDHTSGKGTVFPAGSINGAALTVGSVTSAQIADATILGGDIASSTITTGNIQDLTIQTQDIANQAVQQLIGQFFSGVTFSTTTTASWVTTPITVSPVSSGGMLRVEFNVTIGHSSPTGSYLVGLYLDGTIIMYSANVSNIPAGGYIPISGCYYIQPAAGTRVFVLQVYNYVTGTLTINPTVTSGLYVTEQKK